MPLLSIAPVLTPVKAAGARGLHNRPPMTHSLLIAGGGIGGLALALSCARAGVACSLLEQSAVFSEVGAGIQLGPNAVRVLADWGLMDALREVAAFPERVVVRDARSGQTLGELPLGARAVQRYGQPYATIHRADAHRLLLTAVEAHGGVELHLNARVRAVHESADGVSVTTETGQWHEAQALAGCDGLWSVVRQHITSGPGGMEMAPRFSGHLAYRGVVALADLPLERRANAVTVWLGPRLHLVHYPVSAGQQMNVVAVVHGKPTANPHGWSHEANRADLLQALGPVHADVLQVLEAVPHWKLWPLNDRPPMTGPYQHAQGRVCLTGDAAHPMRPYLAQGAAMALEDAWTLGQLVQSAGASLDWPVLLQRLAELRWARNARVQAGAIRNGTVFHADGWLRMARNVAMAALGERLLDKPWLYSGPPRP